MKIYIKFFNLRIMEKGTEPQSHIDEFVNLAKLNTDEAWEKIDEQLSQHCNEPEVLNWAKGNTANLDSGLSDLAATILEATDEPLDAEDVDNLVSLMRSDNKENPYPSFRAACALAKTAINDSLEESILSEVENNLKVFLKDDDVSDIAKSYIDSLDK